MWLHPNGIVPHVRGDRATRSCRSEVSRSYAVTVCSSLIFDHNEPQPLPLTRLNLERCIGEAYEDAVVRGYEFHRL